MKSTACEALLFDMDGTLVDSSLSITAGWARFASRHGFSEGEVLRYVEGRRGEEIITRFLGAIVPEQLQEELRVVRDEEMRHVSAVAPIGGAAHLLHQLPEDKWAIVTSAPREVMEERLDAAGLPQPAVSVCAENVAFGKPSPDGYIQACELLGVAAAECIGFEDSEAGANAVQASGARLVLVSSDVRAPSQNRVHDLSQVHVEARGQRLRVSLS